MLYSSGQDNMLRIFEIKLWRNDYNINIATMIFHIRFDCMIVLWFLRVWLRSVWDWRWHAFSWLIYYLRLDKLNLFSCLVNWLIFITTLKHYFN